MSPLAADLIGRMLQVNPCHRIRISDIRLHPWLRRHLPIYARISSFSEALDEPQFALDMEVLGRVRALDMPSLRGMDNIERIGKIIRKRMDDSFVTVYELIKDQKDRHTTYQRSLSPDAAPSFQIFSNLPNKLKRQAIGEEERRGFVFGRDFSVGARRLIEEVFAVFSEMEV